MTRPILRADLDVVLARLVAGNASLDRTIAALLVAARLDRAAIERRAELLIAASTPARLAEVRRRLERETTVTDEAAWALLTRPAPEAISDGRSVRLVRA